ncbi:hypothetical protein [Amycolatopsis sp. lyj-108]|uniref:hypothetical protein n=1 Tax=Amycolatopsis sp. lyj-108 TaxID=2789286 RepID=UPI00397C31F3
MRIERSRGTRPGNTGRKAILGALTFAVLTSSLGVPAAVAAPTTPGPKAANAQAPLEESTTDEKSRAAAALGINAHEDMLVLDDRNFVLTLWRKAKEGSEIKSAALMAFTSSDGYASTRFIKTGVYQAKKTDADNEVKDSVAKQQARAAKRNAVAQMPGMEATDEVVNLGEKEFVFRAGRTPRPDRR